MNDLTKSLEKYITFLEKYIGSNAVYLEVHGMGVSDELAAEGEKLRANIAKAKENMQL